MVTSDLYSLPIVQQIGEPLDETLETVVETIQFSIFCFTLPFYIFVIYFLVDAQLHGKQELCTPFFKLCVTTAIIDICTLLNNYLGAMFPKWGWGTGIYIFLDGYCAHFYLYFAWTSVICQAMCVSVLATNRLSAILFPHRHFQLWNSKRLRIAVLIQFVPGMIAGCATFFNSTQLYRNAKNGLVPKFQNEDHVTYFFLIAGAILTVVCVYLIIAYSYLLAVLRKNSNAIKDSNMQKSKTQIKKKEMKLFIMSSITVVIQVAALCLFASYAASILVISLDKFYLLYNAMSDLYAGINPYLLWIFSDSLRKYILIQLGLAKGRMNPTSSVITVTSRSHVPRRAFNVPYT
ncbi:G_PROTEIN_RECEP_F1_2 domain-containing protein [Caenorhabditis elegans]|uniref:G_PROTEIN_RECEP_F1_2 domain-containing protein n=1 Tax=Caenorhabditis elegans TaxID=6239 RepID=Q9XU18_CAEEL|nr:G_PROTEIN_RECEP_F1_2 domain-containing protein [Caenorhabditis elegans]CAB07231.1 G_PROTEIN_RECEP_F1_2 domain-containing protein [Caenorhabditis elegans]|eukprot:NP_502922.1 Serpentine Receptor, class V [Caenorhabditis elegans]